MNYAGRLLLFLALCSICFEKPARADYHPNGINYAGVIRAAKVWAAKIGHELYVLSNTMTRREKVQNSYRETKVFIEDGGRIVQDIAEKIRGLMDKKVEAVKRIKEHAELLALYDEPRLHCPYDFYYANNLTKLEVNKSSVWEQYLEDMREVQIEWKCEEERRKLREASDDPFAEAYQSAKTCNFDKCIKRPENYFRSIPLLYNRHFETEVNLNYSSVRVAPNVYHREAEVLSGVRWSEALDMTFKQNYKEDPTLTWQYFASPSGFMKHYPAISWSDEPYDVTYDFRVHSWYTEAMASPKDMIILFDRSGSMWGKRRKIANHIVNVILDTLNDNDFVNIYTFANWTTPLVDCFNDTLVQANEENLRLLREALTIVEVKFHADIAVGLEKAFQLLERYRKNPERGTQCNQAIMLLTEGIDYDYKIEIMEKYNKWKKSLNRPVRIFTYLIGNEPNDAVHMQYIACQNMGYYVNISTIEEANEKVLKYLPVMSRSVNLNSEKQEAIWSSLYVDLADRRLSNWLWKKFQGNRQREVFLDHAKREVFRLKTFFRTPNHMLLEESHSYEQYKKHRTFNYMTTVSLPVYDRRPNKTELLGVAGIDVPVTLIKSSIPYHRLGVNGYAFIITNNGYVLTHPDLRSEFKNIIKPTYNRVDMTEVEIMDDENEPRLFNDEVVELRKNIVNQVTGHGTLKVKAHIDDMKRILKYHRNYTYTDIGPFSFIIALPAKYGFNNIRYPLSVSNRYSGLLDTKNWKVHPEWAYCEYEKRESPEANIKYALMKLERLKRCNQQLLTALLKDAELTEWFELEKNFDWDLVHKFRVHTVFMAAYSGLTRWWNFTEDNYTKSLFENTHNRAIDEVWYKRAVEENYDKNNSFLYSVPFEIIGFDNSTLITSVHAIFSQTGSMKAPVAVVGMQFNQLALYDLFKKYTYVECKNKPCITCKEDESNSLDCFILDNNGYVVLSKEISYIGNFIGDIRPDIMDRLVKDNVYEATRMFDYQGTCDKPPPSKNPASIMQSYLQNLLEMSKWALGTMLFLLHSVIGGPHYQSNKNKTVTYEKLEIAKTVPTPCDKDMWLFTLGTNTSTYATREENNGNGCSWPYVVQKIPHSNLLLLVINGMCLANTENTYIKSPMAKEISYNLTLPCYIATKNNYTRKHYIKCLGTTEMEYNLNNINRSYCGVTWDKKETE